MARLEANLTTFTLASDYDPAHYNWTEQELAALGDRKTTAEVMKKRLEVNGTKVKEMYAIEHEGEAETDSKSKEHHKGTDEAKPHYHLLVKFEDEQGATLKEIAKYIGVCPEIIEKLKPGRHSYDNMLAYLIHIKYENKIQYKPEDVATLAGTDYTAHYNKRKESWEKARAIIAKKGGKPINRLFREAMSKLDKGEIVYGELRGVEKYRSLLKNPKYARELKKKAECMAELASSDYYALLDKIRKKEITSLDEITTSKDWKLAYKYCKNLIDGDLRLYANK